ncbi:MAG: outer membrane protein assembly factor BamD [Candidatus Neomarinimicrobiota bacterium]|jgi:outer membrane protein assembly factor BamD|nr:outer membrane protein assembly factor BamD [Candidatus Neomarinimicrobiota bacterium]MDD3966986.1 outer membrane protein assembly factor BamD [Candidatus Neomarinimicrobiota bacterium]MDX9781320.1 outer membrane protein assembly factor BamD [bacterium]
MKHTSVLFTLVIAAGIALTGCTGSAETKEKEKQERSYLERYDDALIAFEAKKYYRSIEDFNFVVFNAPGSDIADNAQFYLASAHFELKEYILAIDEYQQLLRRWPESDLYEETRFKIAECYYLQSPGYQRDEEYIHKAIAAYQEFIESYPFSEYRKDAEARIQQLRSGLAKKAYEAGKLYMVLREWSAALITFEEVLNSYYDTSLLNPTYLEMAACYYELENTEAMIGILNKVNPDTLSPRDKRRYRKLFQASTVTRE